MICQFYHLVDNFWPTLIQHLAQFCNRLETSEEILSKLFFQYLRKFWVWSGAKLQALQNLFQRPYTLQLHYLCSLFTTNTGCAPEMPIDLSESVWKGSSGILRWIKDYGRGFARVDLTSFAQRFFVTEEDASLSQCTTAKLRYRAAMEVCLSSLAAVFQLCSTAGQVPPSKNSFLVFQK